MPALLAALLLAALALLAPRDRSQAADPAELVARGAYLAHAAGCEPCHSRPGLPYAGGRLLHTEFGAISVPNITPDRGSGLGGWSEAAFYDAVHRGIGRDGQPLYPVMNYPAFTLMPRSDVDAIRAYLMSLKPVQARRPASQLDIPYNIRATLWLWRALYFRAGSFRADPNRSDLLNRGAYLVQGPGHCGECHTRRNALGATLGSRPLAGGVVAGFLAPDITSDRHRGIGGWSEDELVRFLRSGATARAVAFGPMSEVVYRSLAFLSDRDLHAIAAWLKQTRPLPDAVHGLPPRADAAASVARGEGLYAEHCAACHLVSGAGVAGLIPALAGNTTAASADPRNLMRAMLGGLHGDHGWGSMPDFSGLLDDRKVADIANFLRARLGNAAPANATPDEAAAIRRRAPVGLGGSSEARALGCPPTGAADLPGILASDTDVALLAAGGPDGLPRTVPLLLGRLRRHQPDLASPELSTRLIAAYCPVLAHRPDLTPTQKRMLLFAFPTAALAADETRD